jgi:hypothetical protein
MKLVAALAAVTILALGCGSTRQARSVEQSGFLGDYAELVENPEEGARFRYIRTGVDWKSYDKLMIDPVQFWRAADVEAGLNEQEKQGLINYFHSAVYDRMSRTYEMVSVPQPNALRLSVVFTRLGKRKVALDTVSTFVPQLRLTTELKAVFTGRPAFVGEATLEGKITDAHTGQVLVAAVDRRVGGRTIKDMNTWRDVKNAIDFWADLLAFRTCQLRGDTGCQAP